MLSTLRFELAYPLEEAFQYSYVRLRDVGYLIETGGDLNQMISLESRRISPIVV
jgi:hypothetical protein